MRGRMLVATLPLLVLSPLATVPLAGCIDCYSVVCSPCPAAIAVTVRGATGGLIGDDVVVTATKDGVAASVSCAVGAVDVRCQVYGGEDAVGSYQVTAGAAGWQGETRIVVVERVERDGCCDCGYDPADALFELRAAPP